MKFFVFKTDIVEERQKEAVSLVLLNIKGVMRYSLNLEDKNCSMRVEGHGLKPEKIQDAVLKAGFKCELMY